MQTSTASHSGVQENKSDRTAAKAFVITLCLMMVAATLISLIASQLALHFRWQVL